MSYDRTDSVLTMTYHYKMKISKKQFEKIYDKQVDKIYRFVFLKVGSADIAQDLTSQTFTKAWKKAKSGLDIENPNAYIFQIARREIAGHYRQTSKVKIVSAESVQLVSGEDIEKDKGIQMEFEAIRTCLAELKEDQQNVLVLRYIDDRPIKEIAEMIGKKPGAVKMMIRRALDELREKI